jgi:hypothetical protein
MLECWADVDVYVECWEGGHGMKVTLPLDKLFAFQISLKVRNFERG